MLTNLFLQPEATLNKSSRISHGIKPTFRTPCYDYILFSPATHTYGRSFSWDTERANLCLYIQSIKRNLEDLHCTESLCKYAQFPCEPRCPSIKIFIDNYLYENIFCECYFHIYSRNKSFNIGSLWNWKYLTYSFCLIPNHFAQPV